MPTMPPCGSPLLQCEMTSLFLAKCKQIPKTGGLPFQVSQMEELVLTGTRSISLPQLNSSLNR